MNRTNYTVEADICCENSSGWAGLMYRTASGTSSQKATLTATIKMLNGYTSTGGWYNDKTGVKKFTGIDNSWFEIGKPFRMKVVANENSAELYYATYDDKGVLDDYTLSMSIADNFPQEHMQGSIGLMIPESENGRVWIDNVVVTRGED